MNEQQKTIAIISANTSLSDQIKAVIEAKLEGYDTITYPDSVQGLSGIFNNPPNLIIVDATLSDVSGVQLSRVIKHDPVLRKIPSVLIVQTKIDPYVRMSEFSLIADGFLHKECIETDLIETIRHHIMVFSGLDSDERHQLKLLEQNTVGVVPSSRFIQLLDQRITETDVMKRFRKLLNLIPNTTVMNHMVVSLLDTILDYDGLALFFNDKARLPRRFIYHFKASRLLSEADLEKLTDRLCDKFKDQSTESYLFKEYEISHIDDGYDFAPSSQLDVLEQQAIYPFFAENTLVGGMILLNAEHVNYDLIFPFPLIISEMTDLMRLRRYYSEAQTLSISDPLTGLYSHQHFLTLLDREVQVAVRMAQPLTVLNISIDEFRELNVKKGHQAGDLALKSVAATLLSNLRSIDIVGRVSGRSIFVVLPNTDASGAMIVANRFKEIIQLEPFSCEGESFEMSLSIGMVELSEENKTASALIDQAELAVETARKKGQNRVELIQ